jgi:hypothetical protein
MFLIGDSHATMFVTALRKAIANSYSLSFMTKAKNACFRSHTSYPGYCAAVLSSITRNLRSGDVLVLAFATWQFSPAQMKGKSGSLENVKEYALVLKNWHRLVSARNATMIMLGDQTPLKADGFMCVPTSFDQNADRRCARTVEWSNFYGKHFRNQMNALEQEWHNAYFFDPRALFCTEQSCGAMVPGTHTVATGDDEHLTIEGSYYLWPFLCSFLQEKGLFS